MSTQSAPAPTKKESFLAIRLIFVPFLVAGLGVLWIVTVHPLWRSLAARSWEPAPCRILTSEVERIFGDEKDSFRVKMTYRYEFRGESYTSSRYDFTGASTNAYNWKAQVVERLPPGSTAECFVNPSHPQEAVIERSVRADIAWGLWGVPFAAVGCLMFMKLGGNNRPAKGGAAKTVARQKKRGKHAVEDEI